MADASSLTPAFGLKRISAPPPPAPHLYVLLECDRPLAPPSRHSLADTDLVTFRRGAHRAALRAGRALTLTLSDQWLSGTHAHLERDRDRFVLRDDGSTNGTFVDGAQVRERPLRDGDVIELGHTLLLFRAAAARLHGEPPDLDGGRLDPAGTGLATLSAELQAEYARLATIARSTVSVILGGETGSGQEVVARALHSLSGRPGPFVAVNCGAIAKTLVETELFGYRKGAFSGANEDRTGLVRSADGGTLFLDEIGDLPSEAQAALLRVLQESEVLAVGATRPVKVDVRMLAATHMDLEARVVAGQFRADLLARIAGFTLKLPPLRARTCDLGLLLADRLRRAAGDDAAHVTLTCEAARALVRYPWPLNIRELDQCARAALVLAGKQPIDLHHLPDAVARALHGPALPQPPPAVPRSPDTSGPWPAPAEPAAAGPAPQEPAAPEPVVPEPATPEAQRPLTEAEARHKEELLALVREHKGNVTAIARATGKARMQVQRWLKRDGIDAQAHRG